MTIVIRCMQLDDSLSGVNPAIGWLNLRCEE